MLGSPAFIGTGFRATAPLGAAVTAGWGANDTAVPEGTDIAVGGRDGVVAKVGEVPVGL
jgi:hypothetical protein